MLLEDLTSSRLPAVGATAALGRSSTEQPGWRNETSASAGQDEAGEAGRVVAGAAGSCSSARTVRETARLPAGRSTTDTHLP